MSQAVAAAVRSGDRMRAERLLGEIMKSKLSCGYHALQLSALALWCWSCWHALIIWTWWFELSEIGMWLHCSQGYTCMCQDRRYGRSSKVATPHALLVFQKNQCIKSSSTVDHEWWQLLHLWMCQVQQESNQTPSATTSWWTCLCETKKQSIYFDESVRPCHWSLGD